MIASVDQAAFPAFCREKGLKCTAQRLAVFAAVRAICDHPSVDEIWQRVKLSVPTITRESVYRILNEFVDLGLVGRMDALSAARYDTDTRPHAHFICEVCGKVTDYPMPEGVGLPPGFTGAFRHIELRLTGRCEACRLIGRGG